MNAEEIAKSIAPTKRSPSGLLGALQSEILLSRALLLAIEALETYAQYAHGGETALVSGMLAKGTLAKIRGEEK